jgi:hypothetical protein
VKRFLPVLCLCVFAALPIESQEKPAAPLSRPKNAAAIGQSREDSPNASAVLPNETAAKLPVRRVVLYKNGVGYFEHLGRVRGNQDMHVDFTSAQLNDVLKSLTVLDLSGGRIAGVDYNSEAPLARRLATLRLALGEKPTMAEFLDALRGARLEVHAGNGSALTGKLLGVEQKTKTRASWTAVTDQISLISEAGEVRTAELSPAVSVRIAEKDLQLEVGRYLSLIASSRDQDVRRMTISTAGTGERNLYVSYISEVPIWKTTYRIVLSPKPDKKPLLQGWAIVDNTIGEDWNEVELSLVAGAPHSFIQELSQPYYGRRPVVPLPESVELTPQTHAAALEGPRVGSGTGGGTGGASGGVAGGVMGGVAGGMGTARLPAAPVAVSGIPEGTEVEEAMTESEPAAEGSSLGDLFEYKLKERVTIRKNQSALVPILQTNVEAEKVSLWNAAEGSSRPLRALWINNSSSLTLDGGSFSVLDSNTFAGEGLLEAIKPGERRLLSYATDLGLLVDTKQDSERERVTQVKLFHGMMTTTSEEREKKTYTVRNEDTTPRTLVIEHPARQLWKLAEDGPKPEEKTADLYRFRFTILPKTTEKLTIKEAKPLRIQYSLSDVNENQVGYFLAQKIINPEIERALREIVFEKTVVANLDAQIKTCQKETEQIFADQNRLRENMKALKGSAEEKTLLQRYTKQLDEEETQLDALRKKNKETQVQRDKASEGLRKMIEDLQMDVRL